MASKLCGARMQVAEFGGGCGGATGRRQLRQRQGRLSGFDSLACCIARSACSKKG